VRSAAATGREYR